MIVLMVFMAGAGRGGRDRGFDWRRRQLGMRAAWGRRGDTAGGNLVSRLPNSGLAYIEKAKWRQLLQKLEKEANRVWNPVRKTELMRSVYKFNELSRVVEDIEKEIKEFEVTGIVGDKPEDLIFLELQEKPMNLIRSFERNLLRDFLQIYAKYSAEKRQAMMKTYGLVNRPVSSYIRAQRWATNFREEMKFAVPWRNPWGDLVSSLIRRVEGMEEMGARKEAMWEEVEKAKSGLVKILQNYAGEKENKIREALKMKTKDYAILFQNMHLFPSKADSQLAEIIWKIYMTPGQAIRVSGAALPDFEKMARQVKEMESAGRNPAEISAIIKGFEAGLRKRGNK
ncbi:MAG: hypothetical protein V1494_01500 [Candidatus Diapherotrites archaeon]